MTLGGEKDSVQNPMIRYAMDAGWQYLAPDEALRLRGGETGIVLKELFVDQIQRLNRPFMDHLMAEELIKRLNRITPNIQGNLDGWEYLKGLKTVFVPSEKRERNVTFLDPTVNRNTFHVTDEFRYTNGSKSIRLDAAFLINGVPVLLAETKSASKREGIADALDQVRRYHRDCPELLAILQVYALTHIVKYYYSATWNSSRKYLYDWKDEMQGNYEMLVKAFLDRERVIRVLLDFILFTHQDDELRKVILRPHQMRAVDRIVQRAASDKKHGLVWHTQGSGKTYTMIVAAQKIIQNPLFQNPTVLMMVDRNELESQLFGNLYDIGIQRVEVATSKNHLRELLSTDRRGLIVSMIHKFDNIPANINTRSNIFVLVDEAHRTTGGDLGNYLMAALPNASYIGFTGTPIDRTAHGMGTFVVFGKDDPPQGYMDKYSISESIADGTTVPLHYTLAPNDLLVDKETLNREFLELEEVKSASNSIEELNKVLQRAVNLRNELKNRERVKGVAKYVADHYRNNIEPMGYKAFMVGVDREACAMYKDELDKHLPPEYSEVVYSEGSDDPDNMVRYYLSEMEEKRIRKAFRKPDALPKILIVTEKLLTGFDAPILYCMYLDKPMRDHVLLQAIARVNRPYEDDEGRKKPSGFVLDFVGIFDNLEKALAFDSQDIQGVVHDIELLKGEFAIMMDTARQQYLSIMVGKTEDKAVEAVLNTFMDEEPRQEFYAFFRNLSTIYDILSPDAYLRPYIDDMATLSRMYGIVRSAYDSIFVDREFSRKVAKLVQEHTQGGDIRATLDVYQINEDTLREIEKSVSSDTEKVFNLIRSIERAINDNADREPYLILIGDKAALIAELYMEHQQNVIEALEKLKGMVAEINDARKERAQRDMPAEVFSVYWMFKDEHIGSPEDSANYMRAVLEEYPHWKSSESHERSVRQELYKVLIQSGITDETRVSSVAKRVMRVIMGDRR